MCCVTFVSALQGLACACVLQLGTDQAHQVTHQGCTPSALAAALYSRCAAAAAGPSLRMLMLSLADQPHPYVMLLLAGSASTSVLTFLPLPLSF
jgi:hypothetical protein